MKKNKGIETPKEADVMKVISYKVQLQLATQHNNTNTYIVLFIAHTLIWFC